MNWPVPQDFNEAVQEPGLAFSDPDLKAGQTVVGAHGMPLPRSGNFADVYQLRGADGRNWAVKCFTRPVVGLDQRYKQIGDQLGALKLPVMVDFQYLAEGIRVRGKWHPAVKMEWVEGLLINQFVRENAGKPHLLEALFQMWVRLCRRLREAGIAHADLQHGNVVLVPGTKAGSLGLKLIDYDGLYLPALANQPSGELGHANFQHPERAAKQTFSPDVDRFPHLVIATALKALVSSGPALWERYDTGENLLFMESDFLAPSHSPLMQELLRSRDSAVVSLVSRLAVACQRPIPQTPWLDLIAPDGVVTPPTVAESREAMIAFDLGLAKPAPPPLTPPSHTRYAGTRIAPQGIDLGDWSDAAATARLGGPAVAFPQPSPAASPVAVEVERLNDEFLSPDAPFNPESKLKYAIGVLVMLLILVTGGIVYRLAPPRSPVKETTDVASRSSEASGDAIMSPGPAPAVPAIEFRVPVPIVPSPDPVLAVAPQPRAVAPLAPEPRLVEAVVVVRPSDPPPPPTPPRRLPVPDKASQAKALERVRDLFKSDYVRKLPADRKALATKLLKLAEDTKDDPEGRFAAYQDAREFSIEGHDPSLAMQAVEGLVKEYELDPNAARLQALEKMSTAAYTSGVYQTVFERACAASDAAVDLEAYEAAKKMAEIAVKTATKANLSSGLDEAKLRLTLIGRLSKAYKVVKGTLDLLANNPSHPEANVAVGQFRCFAQGRWEAGLPYLARGNNLTYRAAALAELEPPGETPNNLKIADLWWAAALAPSVPESDRRSIEARARYWYRGALPSLTGLSQKTAEAHLGFSAAGIEYEPGLVVDFSPVKASIFNGKKGRIDATIDFNGKEFSDGKGKSTEFTFNWKGALAPATAGLYVLELKTVDAAFLKVDGKVVIDTKSGKKTATVFYHDRPIMLNLEYKGANTAAHSVTLFWRSPGLPSEELVPAEVLFHDKKAAAHLTR